MSEREELNEDIRGLSEEDRRVERLLASLVPRESRVSRDRVMFLAGQASTVGSTRPTSRRLIRWLWPAATGCAACLGLLFGILLEHSLVNPGRVLVEMQPAAQKKQTVQEPIARPVADMTDESVSADEKGADDRRSRQSFSLLALREQMLATQAEEPSRIGDSFRILETTTRPDPPASYRSLLRQWLAEES